MPDAKTHQDPIEPWAAWTSAAVIFSAFMFATLTPWWMPLALFAAGLLIGGAYVALAYGLTLLGCAIKKARRP